MMETAANYFIGIFFPAFAVVCSYLLYVSWRRGNASVHWPSVKGSVIESRFVLEGDESELIIRYEYLADAKSREGNTVTFSGFSLDLDTLEAYVRKYPQGASVRVYYDPVQPDVSVLEPGVEAKNFLIGSLVLIVLFGAGIGLLAYATRS
jgi:hypothetical protein